MSIFNGKTAVDKNDGETVSTVSGATAKTKETTSAKAVDIERKVQDRNSTNRVVGAVGSKVGFVGLEDGGD